MKTFCFPVLLALNGLLTTPTALAAAQPNLPPVKLPAFRKDTVNITKFGAVPDGLTKTTAIQQGIDACSKAGGGVALVPSGQWLTGPLEMRSNVNLHLAAGALVQFSTNRADYHLIKTNWEGLAAVRNQALIYGINLENIALTGAGVFEGGGSTWRIVKKNTQTEAEWQRLVASGGLLNEQKDMWYPSEQSRKGAGIPAAYALTPGKDVADYEAIKDFLRPDFLVLDRCKRILLDGLTYNDSPAWTLHPIMSEDITVRNVTVKNPWYGQNTDGIDLESCKNGVLENSSFDVGDDGICIKSGRNEQGRQRGIPTENFIIRNCTVYKAHGGFVIGSEMSSGARNIYVSNCTFIGTDAGLRFKSARGRGGVVENIFIDGVSMKDIAVQAIVFDMYYTGMAPTPMSGESKAPPIIAAQAVNEGTPTFRHIEIRNVRCNGAETGLLIRGLPEMPVRDILIENAVLQSQKALVCFEAENIRLKNITLVSAQTKPVLEVQNSQDLTLDGVQYASGAELLMRVTGARNRNIKLLRTDASKAKQELELGEGVSKKVVSRR